MQEDFLHVATDVDVSIRAGEMRPMIVIGIENTQRRRNMTGPTSADSDHKIAVHLEGSAAFSAFIANEQMTGTLHRCRTNSKTVTVGESLSDVFVAEAFFEQPKLVDIHIAFSHACV